MNEFTMPYQKEKESDEKNSSSWDKRLFKPLPDKAGLIVNNDVIVPLFSPHNWKLFNPTPEDAQKYGMVGSGLVSMNPTNPIHTFYFRLPVHNIQNFNHPDGSVKRFAQVVCPIALNRYLVESLGRGPLFESPRCAFCEQEQRHWDAFNARWENCGTDKSTLSKEGYWKFIDDDDILSAEREGTRKFGVNTRYVISVFDHAKFVGTRPLDDGETGVEHQIWFAPKGIYTKLLQLYEAGGPGGFRFFEPTLQGFPILFVSKDTSKCKAGDMRNTEYNVGFVNRYHPYPPEWVEYIQNSEAKVDPSEFVHLITYEDGRYYVESQQSSNRNSAGTPVAGAPPAMGSGVSGFAPPVGIPQGIPQSVSPGSVSPDGYAAPVGAVPQGAPPVGAPPVGAPPVGAPPVAMGAPIPAQPQVGAPVPSTATPGGPVPVVAPVATQGAPLPAAPPAGMPPAVQPPSGATASPPMGTPPGVPGAAPAVAPAGAPLAVPGAPPATTAAPVGSPPDRTPPGGQDPPGRRRSW